MARDNTAPHSHVEVGTSTDYLLLLRFNEAFVASGFADELGARTMSQTGSPTVHPSLTNDSTAIGARGFNGTTQYGSRASDTDETLFQTLQWGIACWADFDSVVFFATLAEYGEFSSPETEATNVQMGFHQSGSALQMRWEFGAGATNVAVTTPAGVLTTGKHHVGVACEPDPDNIGKARLRFHVDGVCVYVEGNVQPMTGGSTSRWLIGASAAFGSAVGTPGAFFDGRMDDLVVTRWTPDVAWFRSVYARGVQDFEKRLITDVSAKHFATHVRVLVEVPATQFLALPKVDVDWVDLTDVNGIDFVRSVSWGADVDDFIASGTVRLQPRFGFYNASPFVGARAGFNGNDNPMAEPSLASAPVIPLLKSMRRCRIEVAVAPCGMSKALSGPHFEVMLDGFIRAVDVTDSDVTVTVADKGIALLDVFMEPDRDGTDRQYGSPAGSPVQTELQDIIDDNDPARFDVLVVDQLGGGGAIRLFLLSTTALADINGKGKPHTFQALDTLIVSGTVAYNTPAGAVDTVASVNATSVTLVRVLGATPAETVGRAQASEALSYKGRKPTLYVPTSPLWNVFEWNEPASKGVLQSLDDIAAQIGWRVSMRWHQLRQEHRLTLFNPTSPPAFANYSPVFTGILALRRMSSKVDDVRNVIVTEYFADVTKDPVGERIVYIVQAKNLASLRDYGRRMGRVRAAGDNLISASGEAQEFTDTTLADLRDPLAETEVEILFENRLEVQDGFRIRRDADVQPQMLASDHTGAVVSITHSFDAGQTRTTARLRRVVEAITISSSVARANRYAEMMQQRGSVSGRGLSPPSTPPVATLVYSQNVGGAAPNRVAYLTWPLPANDFNQAWDTTEVHVSTTINFTPSSSTLKGTTRSNALLVGGLAAATTHYTRLVHRDRMKNRAVGPQGSFVTV